MKQLICILLLSCSLQSQAQEFFPYAGSASLIPKGVLGVKLSNEFYQDVTQTRFSQGYTLLYGISSKLELSETIEFSNHHDYLLQPGFITTNTNGTLTTPGYIRGEPYPYLLGTFIVNVKYRFLNIDGTQTHFRIAAYLQLAGGDESHSVSEPSITGGDNSGVAPGLIATYLKHKFAISFSGGAIFPHAYSQPDSNIYLHYGNALTYSLSFGYLLFPIHYKDYKQTNINLYMEFAGESYEGMQSITQNGQPVYWYNVPSLSSGHYLEARPAIQFIFLSNTRVDLSMAYLVSGQSYERSYPLYFISLIHNFYM